MSKTTIYGVVAFVVVGVLGIYYFNFNVHDVNTLSNEQGDWGSFGSYFGGVVGPILAFLAYVGVKEQIKIQQSIIEQQNATKALEDHLSRVKESFERLVRITNEALLPLEKRIGISLSDTLTSDLGVLATGIDLPHSLDDVIHAGRLIQGAEFVFKSYLALIEESSKHLAVKTPLNEHKWVAIVTWREFEKKALFINCLMKVVKPFTESNPDIYSEEHKEVLIYIAAFELWEEHWKRMGLGF